MKAYTNTPRPNRKRRNSKSNGHFNLHSTKDCYALPKLRRRGRTFQTISYIIYHTSYSMCHVSYIMYHTSLYVYIHTWYVHMCIYIYIYICACVYIYIYTHIHTYIHIHVTSWYFQRDIPAPASGTEAWRSSWSSPGRSCLGRRTNNNNSNSQNTIKDNTSNNNIIVISINSR